jgi:LEA14-like dessication related protein
MTRKTSLAARIALLLLPAALLAGCAGLTDLKKPEVQIASIQTGTSTLLEQELIVTLRVQNPNDRALEAKGIYFELSSQGKRIATGVSNQPISIPAMGEGQVPLTVHASLLDSLALARAALQGDQPALQYQLSGYIDGLNGWGRIPFKRDGEWKLQH